MRYLLPTTLVLILGITCGAFADDLQAPLADLDLNDGDSIVFLGDSITHQCLYTQYVEDFLYTRYPHLRLKLHNAGVGGARAWDALQRFDDDVAAYKPKYVTILLGMNDGTYQPYVEEIFRTYRDDMTQLLGRITDTGATPILMTPTMYDARAARLFPRRKRDPDSVALYNSVLAYYGTWCRDVAQVNGYGFVDMWGPLNNLTLEQRKTDPEFTMIRDAVHPGPDGQLVMASAIISDLGLRRTVSNIRLTKLRNGKWNSKVTGGKLSDLTETDEGLSFTWAADALPWVVPEIAQLGIKLTRMGHKLSREALEIHGLEPGQYTLSIDGVDVGKYAATGLERHIELQSNAKTPQYQQALEVAMINKERNERAVRSLRGEWSKFQAYARVRRQAGEQPENEDLQNQLQQTEARVDGMEDRVAQYNAAAKELEDSIFEINRPPSRRYVLTRVK